MIRYEKYITVETLNGSPADLSRARQQKSKQNESKSGLQASYLKSLFQTVFRQSLLRIKPLRFIVIWICILVAPVLRLYKNVIWQGRKCKQQKGWGG